MPDRELVEYAGRGKNNMPRGEFNAISVLTRLNQTLSWMSANR
jgi:hypothetical protein